MRVLLFSTVVYLAGIAVVLFLRPVLMFDREGRWKEFGLRRDDATVFPFWMFCIVWAFVSYFMGRLSLPTTPTDWVQSASTAASVATAASGLRGSLVQPLEAPAIPQPSSENMVTPLPVSGPSSSASKGGRRRTAAAAAMAASKLKKLKQLGGGKQFPKGLYLYMGDDTEGAEEDDDGDSSEESDA